MLYEMLTGRPPFLGDEAVAIISQHIGTAPVAPSWHTPDVPPALERLVLGLLAKDPEKRPQSATEVRDALLLIATATSTTGPAAAAREEANPLDRLAGGVFVGREREMDDLRGGLDDALSGRGRLLLLMGEPGIGKTRMADELTTYARLRGAQVLVGRCYEGEGAPAFWPWVQVIRSYVHDRDADALRSVMGTGAADIAQVVSEIRDRIPDLPEPPALDPEQARFRLFDSIGMLLRNASRAQPLVVVLDDLHWSDEPSLLLLQFLAREMRSSRLLILGTYRDVELRRQHPLARTLADLARENVSQRVVLRGLLEEDVARYIEMTSGIAPSPELARTVHRETEGNPFFVSEIVRLLASEGKLERPAEGSWSISIPQSVREVVGRRLDQLSDGCNELLRIASVVGRDFALGVVQAAGELDGVAVMNAIEEARAARVIGEAPRSLDRYTFSHALIRETLYEEIPTSRRVMLHRRIGEVLEALYADAQEPHLAELAHHFLEAAPGGDLEKALSYGERAADRALAQLAYEDAVRHCLRALDALELAPGNVTRRCAYLLRLGEAQRRAGDTEGAREAFFKAADLARTTGDMRALAEAGIGLRAGASFGSVDERRAAILEEALAGIGGDDPALRSRLSSELARTLYFSPQTERIRRLAEDAVAAGSASDDPIALAEALSAQAYVLWLTDPPEERIESGKHIAQLARPVGDLELLLDGIMWGIIGFTERADIKRAAAAVEEYAKLAEESRIPRYMLYAYSRRATMAGLAGRYEEFDRWVHLAYDVGTRAQEPDAIQVYTGQIMVPSVQRGDLEKVKEAIASLTTYSQGFGARLPWFDLLYAYLRWHLGEHEEAVRDFDLVMSEGLNSLLWGGLVTSFAAAMLAELAVEMGRFEQADDLIKILRPFENRNIVAGGAVWCLGAGARYMGLLEAATGRLEEAIEHHALALELHERMAARPWIATTLLDQADAWLRRGGPGDATQAIAALDRALGIAHDIGMTPLAERAVALKLEAQGAVLPADIKTSIDRVASSLERERPNLRTHAAPDGTVTLLFTDIEGSTALNEQVGDRRWIELLRVHNAIVREQVTAQSGFEVKSSGDGFMVAFSSARRALACAVQIQRALAGHADKNPDDAIRVRIGLHTGEAIAEEGDFYGRHVNLAARVGAAAEGGEILVSSLLRELTASSKEFEYGEARDVQLKGLAGTHRLYPVRW
jgi:eukaryotic-like serine/threonine-protein kinase